MSLSQQNQSFGYVADGITTVFPYTCRIWLRNDLTVTANGNVVTNYTVSGIGQTAGGAVTFAEAPTSGAAIMIKRNLTLTRSVTYTTAGDFRADTVNSDQDYQTALIQQVDADLTATETQLRSEIYGLGLAVSVVDLGLVDNLEAAVATFGAAYGTITIATSQTLTGSLTLHENLILRIIKPAVITVPNGATLTINSPFECGMYQTFNVQGSVSVILLGSKTAYPEWWGAQGNGINNDTAHLNNAAKCFGGKAGTVLVPKCYAITDSIVVPSYVVVSGINADYESSWDSSYTAYGSTITVPLTAVAGMAGKAMINLNSTTGVSKNITIRDINFRCSGNPSGNSVMGITDAQLGANLGGTAQTLITRCHFSRFGGPAIRIKHNVNIITYNRADISFHHFIEIYGVTGDSRAIAADNLVAFNQSGGHLSYSPQADNTLNSWTTSTQYIYGQTVIVSGVFWMCAVAHTSGVFATDQTAGKWVADLGIGSLNDDTGAIGSAIRLVNAQSNKIIDNFCYNFRYGIELTVDYHGQSACHNLISGNRCEKNGVAGIHLGDKCHDNQITNNSCYNNGYVTSSARAGIYLYKSYNNIISNNALFNEYGYPPYPYNPYPTLLLAAINQQYGIYGDQCICENITANMIRYAATNGIKLVSSQWCIVNDNTIDTVQREGIVLTGAAGAVSLSNAVKNNQLRRVSQLANQTFSGILLDTYCDNNTVHGNTVSDDDTLYCKSGYAIKVGATAVNNNSLMHNNFAGLMGYIENLGTGTKQYDNMQYLSRTGGTATIGSGATIVGVSHGLGYAIAPQAQDIQVTPLNNLGNATKYWVSNINSVSFNINVNTDPGATTAIFAWQANLT